MSSELIAVLGTIFGALVGGLINYFSSRSTKNYEWSLALAKESIAYRQNLYSEFLVETQRLVMVAAEQKVSSVNDFNHVGGKFAEISLVAPNGVVEAAQALIDSALEANSRSNQKEGIDFYKRKQAFIVEAKKDIESIRKSA